MGSNCQFADEPRRGGGPSPTVHLDARIALMLLAGIPYTEAARGFRREYIRRALLMHRGHQGHTAEALGMHRNTLSRTMIELGLDLLEIRQFVRDGRHNHSSEEHECHPLLTL